MQTWPTAKTHRLELILVDDQFVAVLAEPWDEVAAIADRLDDCVGVLRPAGRVVLAGEIGAGTTAEQIRERYGWDSLQLDPLQAARLEGKLSALRWALGDDWDNLDT